MVNGVTLTAQDDNVEAVGIGAALGATVGVAVAAAGAAKQRP